MENQAQETFTGAIVTLNSHQTIREDSQLVKKTIARHDDDIGTLKDQLKEKEDEIISLRKMVKALESKNGDLEIELRARNDEIKCLKGRIGKLEKEKKAIEDELTSVQAKLGRVEREVEDLKESKIEQQDTNTEMKEKIGKISKRVEWMTDDLKQSNEENRTLKKELKDLRDTQQKSLRQITGLAAARHPEDFMPFLQSGRKEPLPMLYLGEMCWQIQAKMYQTVLPAHYTPVRSYKIKAIERDMVKLPKSEKAKADAKRRYDQLKEKLNWQEKYVDVMKSLQDSRNIEAHPTLNEETLSTSVKNLEKDGVLKGWLSLESIEELIGMWGNLQK